MTADAKNMAILLEALQWYADRNNYLQRSGPFVFVPDVDGDTLQAPALDDKGSRARSAIAKIEGRGP